MTIMVAAKTVNPTAVLLTGRWSGVRPVVRFDVIESSKSGCWALTGPGRRIGARQCDAASITQVRSHLLSMMLSRIAKFDRGSGGDTRIADRIVIGM